MADWCLAPKLELSSILKSDVRAEQTSKNTFGGWKISLANQIQLSSKEFPSSSTGCGQTEATNMW
jgi:hypothetical protein